ncbi:molybdopterin-synthase adenylyltransferase MoeB [Vibrio gazogenes]|uniref:Molybdopterin-synthase adenylyltransferase n=1 Tax=Vibrio gazogenes DSM 21264 = NBRC 103151 TaxID=1123492 RepID=A0A1M5C859_VIBGA|nr:molybdopterin-synthase adenylyltransferase MoeB [Vibrio gazogenes]USP16296.1 molybdopterin-synthase adenylyltransferase MoeB [Vibrio gazogenes]SHF50974.1 [molybdopterin synthase] sulfurylase [Vibrio gazogenes DSM 21264] [Vibrio gazogenes DSM 21264 = NBRC 103151]SJN55367.1 Molybdopterin-synthase adenylyltransferase [Vibrio gazogenes]
MTTHDELLSDEEHLRYNRQIILKQFDFEGQEALKEGRVLIIGAGGLGCAASQYLASAGVGNITLVDDDVVELSNLQRQILHTDQDIGRLKVDSAADSLRQLNPYLRVKTIAQRLDESALLALMAHHDAVLDASDNIATRNQLNQLCFQSKTPLISGAAIRMEGFLSVFTYQAGEPCYQCFSTLFGNHAPTCVENGVLAPVVGVIGAMQALETLKVLANYGQPLRGKVLLFDAMTLSWQAMKLPQREHCPVCCSTVD